MAVWTVITCIKCITYRDLKEPEHCNWLLLRIFFSFLSFCSFCFCYCRSSFFSSSFVCVCFLLLLFWCVFICTVIRNLGSSLFARLWSSVRNAMESMKLLADNWRLHSVLSDTCVCVPEVDILWMLVIKFAADCIWKKKEELRHLLTSWRTSCRITWWITWRVIWQITC